MATDLTQIKAVSAYLHDPDIYDHLDKIAEDHKLPEERIDELLDLTDAIFVRKIKLSDMPKLLEQSFGLDSKNAVEVARDVIGYRLLPLANYLPNVTKQVEAWGGKISDYPAVRIGRETATIEMIISRISAKHEVALPEYLRSRLAHFAKSYLEKIRAEEPTVVLMMRPSNIGGLGLSEKAAKNILTALETERTAFMSDDGEVDVPEVIEAMRKVQNIDDNDNDDITEDDDSVGAFHEMPDEPEPPVEIPSEAPVKKSTHIDDLDKIDKEELMKLAQSLKDDTREPDVDLTVTKDELIAWARRLQDDEDRASVGPKNIVMTSTDDSSTASQDRIDAPAKEIQNSKSKKAKPIKPVGIVTEDLTKHNLPVKTIKREVAKQAPVVLGKMIKYHEEDDIKKGAEKVRKSRVANGGEKDKQAEVNKILKPLIEIFRRKRLNQKVFKEVAQSHVKGLREPLSTQQLLKDKYKFVDGDVTEIMAILEKARKIAQGEHIPLKNRKISELPRKSNDKFEILKKEKDLLNKRHAALTNKVSDKPIEPISTAQVSAARTKEEELALQADRIDTVKVKKAETASKPKKARAKLSVASTPPGKKRGGRIADVKFEKRLLGPVEELQVMSVIEFRRLSSDPNEAVRKLLNKLDLLEKMSFEERIRGVRAWRQSPTNKLYVKMTEEALAKGFSMVEAASSRRNAGEESLSPKEVRAIVKMNKAIRF